MKSLMLLAALVAGVPSNAAEPRWVTYTKNPAYEVFGTEDGAGVFRYSETRLKAEAQPTKNYGVQLSPKDAAFGQSVMGTDGDAAKLVLSDPTSSEACGPDGCPKRPDLVDEVEQWALPSLHPIAWVGIALAALLIGVFLVFLAVASILFIVRALSSRTSP